MTSNLSIPTRCHPFPLDLSHTAVVAIDLQKDFCDPDGFCADSLGLDLSPVRAIIPRVQNVIDWARKHDIWVIYTIESHKPDLSDAPLCKQLRYQNAGYPIGAVGKRGRFAIQGDRGSTLIEELQPLPSELQIYKPAQSIFVGTNLDVTLRERDITHLIFTGVTTECCVLASYRHATDLGFYGLLLDDCCAAFLTQEHDAAIEVLLGENGAIGWVTSSEQLLNA